MKFRYLIFLVIFLLASCKGENDSAQESSSASYKPVQINVNSHENSEVIQLDLVGLNFPISIIYFKGSERTFIETSNKRRLLEDFSWSLNDEFSLNTDEFFLFKDKDEYLLMFPTYTEEFPVFHLLGVSKTGRFVDHGTHTYSYEDFEKLNMKFPDVKYLVENKNDTLRIFAQAKSKILLSELKYGDNEAAPISQEERLLLEGLLKNDLKRKSIELSNGEWQPNCESSSGYFNIVNDSLELHLRMGQAGVLYLMLEMKQTQGSEEIALFFDRIIHFAIPMGGEAYYERPPEDGDISKEQQVGKLIVESSNRCTFIWNGLYHLPTKTLMYQKNLDYPKDKDGKTNLYYCE